MSVSKPLIEPPHNGLYRIAGASGFLLGLLLLAGTSGHITAVWPMVTGEINVPVRRVLLLLLPGLILAISTLVNLLLCQALWTGRRWALTLTLGVNLIAAVYFAYLLHRGVQDHPIGLFLAFIASQVIVLAAIQIGLTWPAKDVKEEER